MATSLVLLLQRCNFIRHVCWSSANLRYACLYNAPLSDMHAGLIYSDTRVWKVLLHQARFLVCQKSTSHVYRLRVCKTYQLPSWTPSWIYRILSDALAASLGCYKDDFCNWRISKMQIPGVCRPSENFLIFFWNKLPFGRPFCLNSFFIFRFLLWAKCIQLDSNAIANNLRKKWVWDTFPYHTIF